MNFRKVTAIFSSLELDNVEKALIGIGVPGMTVSRTHGFGEYRNFYAKDIMTDGVRVEIFTDADTATEIVKTIARTVHQGLDSDGIIAVLPVEDLLHIREFKGA
jgi:nitrogen regulatory protein P-II 1